MLTVRRQKVRKMFEMYAIGNYTLHSLADWYKENDLVGNLGKPLVIANIQKIQPLCTSSAENTKNMEC